MVVGRRFDAPPTVAKVIGTSLAQSPNVVGVPGGPVYIWPTGSVVKPLSHAHLLGACEGGFHLLPRVGYTVLSLLLSAILSLAAPMLSPDAPAPSPEFGGDVISSPQ
jgi:hypothetical protein